MSLNKVYLLMTEDVSAAAGSLNLRLNHKTRGFYRKSHNVHIKNYINVQYQCSVSPDICRQNIKDSQCEFFVLK